MNDTLCWIIGCMCWLTAAAIMLYMFWPVFFTQAEALEVCNHYNTWVGVSHWPDHPRCWYV